jgi:hypothetical protein
MAMLTDLLTDRLTDLLTDLVGPSYTMGGT